MVVGKGAPLRRNNMMAKVSEEKILKDFTWSMEEIMLMAKVSEGKEIYLQKGGHSWRWSFVGGFYGTNYYRPAR